MAVEGPALSDIERRRRLQAVTDAALAHLSVDELLGEVIRTPAFRVREVDA